LSVEVLFGDENALFVGYTLLAVEINVVKSGLGKAQVGYKDRARVVAKDNQVV
jgi:hypothetical protein